MKTETKTEFYKTPWGDKIIAHIFESSVQWGKDGSLSQTLESKHRFYARMERNKWERCEKLKK